MKLISVDEGMLVKLLIFRLSTRRSLRLPRSVGTYPEKELLEMSRLVSRKALEREEGTTPFSSFFAR